MSRQMGFVCLSLVAMALFVTACTGGLPIATATPAAASVATDAPAAAETVTQTTSVTSTASLSSTSTPSVAPSVEETTSVSTSELSGVLTGTVSYLQRIALPAGSVIDVRLQDVSLADAPAQLIASQTITTTGENVPIPFTINYDPAQIDPRFTYALAVRITIDGQLRWINTQSYPVLTRGAPLTGVEVVVEPVQ